MRGIETPLQWITTKESKLIEGLVYKIVSLKKAQATKEAKPSEH